MNPTALKESEVAGETVADAAGTSDKEPLFHTVEPTSDEVLEGAEEDAAPKPTTIGSNFFLCAALGTQPFVITLWRDGEASLTYTLFD